MTGLRRPAAAPDYQPGQLLDWRDSSHWADRRLPCRYCGQGTNLRDSKGKPAHKTCAETALAQQTADTTAAYQNGHQQ